jgi:hypothetical protein
MAAWMTPPGSGMARPAGGSYRLVMLRHGQSEWNAKDLFTGWVNAPLTEAGERASRPRPGRGASR